MDAIIDRHKTIALQVSGGRDSIACLYLMRPYLDRITVYWVNTGAAFPETLSTIATLRALCPNFIEIDGGQPGVVEQFGMPSDIVPVSRLPMGVFAAGQPAALIQDRYSCCARVVMIPLHQRMLDDGVTLIIRGQKNADKVKSTIRSGNIENGIEYLFPIEDWDARKVMTYLREQGAPIPRFYEMLHTAPDCMTCSAWWEEGAMAYLKRYHHAQYQDNLARLDTINQAVGAHIAAFNKEVAT